jgi:hypothetical protein
MSNTKPLHELIDKSNDDLREAKEKLFRALHERSTLDYLTENEQELMWILSEDPAVKRSCRDLF